MIIKRLLFFFLFLESIIYSAEVKYEVRYGFFPAGIIKISFSPTKVVVKGKSSGLLSWFYHYKLYMVFDLNRPQKSFLVEDENGKHRVFSYQRIIQKKAWLPLVVNILLKGPNPENLKFLTLDGYKITLSKKEKDNYYFEIEGSKKIKNIKILNWKHGDFPQKIVIEAKDGTLVLEKN